MRCNAVQCGANAFDAVQYFLFCLPSDISFFSFFSFLCRLIEKKMHRLQKKNHRLQKKMHRFAKKMHRFSFLAKCCVSEYYNTLHRIATSIWQFQKVFFIKTAVKKTCLVCHALLPLPHENLQTQSRYQAIS